jgi:hypothetical protein
LAFANFLSPGEIRGFYQLYYTAHRINPQTHIFSNTVIYNDMKQIFLIFLFITSLQGVIKAQELVEKGDAYFLNGELYNGKWTTYYENGSVKMITEIKKGFKDGQTKIWFEDGQLNEIRSYKQNKMHGKWVMYNNHNIKISVARYKNGLKHGKWTIWNDYGNLLYELEYNNGEKTGTWKNYNEKGELVSERKY